MDQSLLIVILLGMAAAILPWHFAYEIYLFGDEGGAKKAGVFVGGITFFRVLLIFLVGMLFAGLTAFLTEKIVDVAQFARQLLLFLGHEVTSGHRTFIDALVVFSGLLLLIEAFLHFRRVSTGSPEKEMGAKAQQERSARGLFLLGLGWAAISVNQWLFTLTAANEILAIGSGVADRVLYALLFLLLASLLIGIPFLIYLFNPQGTTAILNRLNKMINTTFGYLIVILMAGAGAYLIWLGARGLYKYAF